MQNRIDLTDSATRGGAADGCALSLADARGCPAGAVVGPEVPFWIADSGEGTGGAAVVVIVVSVVVIVVAAVVVVVVAVDAAASFASLVPVVTENGGQNDVSWLTHTRRCVLRSSSGRSRR